MKPTTEQQAVIDAAEPIIKMIAYAGTGKTSTFVERAKRTGARTLYIPFNKTTAEEAKRRFPKSTKSTTQHALAFANIMAQSGRYTLRTPSVFKVAKRFRIDYYMSSLILKTIENFCNSAEMTMDKTHVAPDTIKRYSHDITDVVLDFARQSWNKIVAGGDDDYPMPHHGYLKLYQLSQPVLRYDEIMLDEAQDTNPVTQDFVMRQAQHGTRILLAGDPYQQIYAWRGAVDALGRVEANPYYITQSFRFGPQVAGVANTILRTFFNEQRPLVGLGSEGVIAEEWTTPPYTYLSRTNAFLFAHACGLAGRYTLYTPGTRGNEMPLFASVMDTYHLFKDDKYSIKDHELKFFQDWWEFKKAVEDGVMGAEYVVSAAIVEKYKEGTPQQIEKVRASLVDDPAQAQINLFTAHRAKGLEWDNVILCDDFVELFDEESGKLKQLGTGFNQIPPDEINLLYVAATRAKKVLVPNRDLQCLLETHAPIIETPTGPVS